MSASDEKGEPDAFRSQSAGSLASSETAHHQSADVVYGHEKNERAQETIPAGASKADADVETAEPMAPPPDSDANENYKPKTLKFWLIILSAVLAMFLVALDRTILSTAIPRITDEFNSLGDIGWYGSAYMLTTAAFQLFWGRIYRFYDLRWSFLCCIFIFEVGSAICGAAPNSPVFIFGRAIAGVGAAGITTGSLLTTVPMVPLHKRPMYQSLFALVFGIASISGPLLGGVFTESVSWRWSFYINLPVGVVAFVFLLFFLRLPNTSPKTPTPVMEHVMRLDPIGTLLFIPSTACLLLALQWGGSTYSWSNWRIILLFVMFVLAGLAFAVVQVKLPNWASLPPRVITQRTTFFGTFYMLFLSGAMMLCIYYIPLWFQTTHNAGPIQSGIYTIPLVLSLVIAGLLSSVITQRSGYYVPSLITCPCLMAIGEGLLTTFKADTGSPHWIAFQFLTGFGLGFGLQTVGIAVQATLPKEDVPTGIAITFFAQQLGGAIFVSVGQTVLDSALVSQLANVPGLSPAVIVSSGATQLSSAVPAQFIPTVVDAYNYACTRIFWAAFALTCIQLLCVFGIEWKSIKKNAGGRPSS